MQFGMTIIMPNFGDWLDFNKKFDVGINIDVLNSVKTANIINQLDKNKLKKYSNQNINSLKNNFLWNTQEKKLISIYNT